MKNKTQTAMSITEMMEELKTLNEFMAKCFDMISEIHERLIKLEEKE